MDRRSEFHCCVNRLLFTLLFAPTCFLEMASLFFWGEMQLCKNEGRMPPPFCVSLYGKGASHFMLCQLCTWRHCISFRLLPFVLRSHAIDHLHVDQRFCVKACPNQMLQITLSEQSGHCFPLFLLLCRLYMSRKRICSDPHQAMDHLHFEQRFCVKACPNQMLHADNLIRTMA
jgi:hypothetical protein